MEKGQLILRSGKNFRQAFIKLLIVIIAGFLFLTSLSTPGTASEQRYAIKSSSCYDRQIESSLRFMQSIFLSDENYFKAVSGYLDEIDEISVNLEKVSEATIPSELVEKANSEHRKYEIVSTDMSLSEHLIAERKAQEVLLNETLHEFFELMDATSTIAELYDIHGKTKESINHFLENFDFKNHTNVAKTLSDPLNIELTVALIEQTSIAEFKQYSELRKVYGKLNKIFDFENSAILTRTSYDPFFNEIFSVCEISLFHGFNSDFFMRVPDDLDFIIAESSKELRDVEDIILGAQLSGVGMVQDISTCEKPTVLYEACTQITIKYDDNVIILITEKLSAKERYRYKIGTNLQYSNCVFTAFNDHRGSGGWQFGEYFRSFGPKFKSAVLEGLESGRKSSDFDFGYTDGIYAFASKVLETDLMPDYHHILVCETSASNLQTIDE